MIRRKFTSEFKAKIVLEVLREERTLGEIAAEYEINPNQITNWKREFMEKAATIFDESRTQREARQAERKALEDKTQMLKTIGQLTMERDFLLATREKTSNRRSL